MEKKSAHAGGAAGIGWWRDRCVEVRWGKAVAAAAPTLWCAGGGGVVGQGWAWSYLLCVDLYLLQPWYRT